MVTDRRVSVNESLILRLGSMLLSIKLVFSHWEYIVLGGTIATIFWIVFNVFEQLLFLSPIVIFYLPEDAITGFILSNITAILLEIVVSMNVYVLKHSRDIKLNASSFFSGSSIGVLSSTCTSCSSRLFTSVYIRWSRDNNFYISIKLSDANKNHFYSTPAMGVLFNKY
jgi:hypothetical protein